MVRVAFGAVSTASSAKAAGARLKRSKKHKITQMAVFPMAVTSFFGLGGGGHRRVQLPLDGSVDLSVYHAADIALYMALQPHRTLAGSYLGRFGVSLDAGALDDSVAQHQKGGQYKQHQENGNDGATAQASTHNGYHGLGGQIADEQTGGSHHSAGSEYCGESGVQSVDNSLLRGHFLFQFLIMAGDDNGVVDIRAHHNGVYNEVAQEVQRLARKGGDGEIDPDTALNDNDQQHRQTHRPEGKQQHDDHKQG